MRYINQENVINKYDRNIYFLNSITDAASKSLLFILFINVVIFIVSLYLNNISVKMFSKEIIMIAVNQINSILPFIISTPILFSIWKEVGKIEGQTNSYILIGKLVGASTILTITPFVSTIVNNLLKTLLF